MNDQDKKIRALRYATRALHTAQEDLRLARAEYNKAVSDLVEGD